MIIVVMFFNISIYLRYICCYFAAQLCLALCSPMDCSPLGSCVHETSQARILAWVAIPFSRGSS